MLKFFKSETVKNSFTLFSGTLVAQIIPFLITPVLSRLYTPIQFGTLATFTTVFGLLSIAINLRLDQAIVLPKNKNSAIGLLLCSTHIATLIAVFLFLLILFVPQTMVRVFIYKEYDKNIYFLLPLVLLFTGIYQPVSNYFIRVKKFKSISNSRIVKSIATSIAQVLFAIANLRTSGLILGSAVGVIASLLAFKNFTISKVLSYCNINWTNLKGRVSTYSDFPRYNLPNNFLNTFSINSPILFLAAKFDANLIGYYSFGLRLLEGPMSIVSTSIAQVVFQEISIKIIDKKLIYKFVKDMYFKLFVLTLPIYTVIFIFSPIVFKIIFGAQWETAGVYARIISPWLFLSFISMPGTYLIVALNKQKHYFYYEILLIISRLSVLSYAIYNSSYQSAIINFSCVGLIFSLIIIIYTLFICKQYDQNISNG